MVKKVMKWILIVIAALIGLVIVGVTLLVAISNYKGANYWKFAEPKGMIETKYTGMGKHEVSLAEFDAPPTWNSRIRHTRLLSSPTEQE